MKLLSHVRLVVTPWTAAYQAPASMGFFRQEYWSGLPFPSPGNLPDPGIELGSPALQADSLPSKPPWKSAATHFQRGPSVQIWDNLGKKMTAGMDCDSWNKTEILESMLE